MRYQITSRRSHTSPDIAASAAGTGACDVTGVVVKLGGCYLGALLYLVFLRVPSVVRLVVT